MSIIEFFKKNAIEFKENFDTSLVSWFKIGIKISFFVKIENKNQLEELLNFINKDEYKIIICGLLSNMVFCGKTKKKIILIKLSSDFSKISIQNDTIVSGASVSDRNFSLFCKDNSIKNFEFLFAIPGSIGGGIPINAGCYGSEMFENLIDVSLFDFEGNFKILKKNDIKFGYRETNLEDSIILSARFNINIGNRNEIEEKMNHIFNSKNESQITNKTLGSTFKNPNKKVEINGKVIEKVKSWELIDACGLRGFSLGNICISEKHCNFLYNKMNEEFKDDDVKNFLSIIEIIKEKVYQKFGILLKEEVFIM